MDEKKQSSLVSKPRTRFRRVARFVFIAGKWSLIAYSGLSAIFLSYIIFPIIFNNIASRLQTVPAAPLPLISRDEDDDPSMAEVPVEEDDSLPKADTNEAQLLPTNPPPTSNSLVEKPSLQQTTPSFGAGAAFPYPTREQSPIVEGKRNISGVQTRKSLDLPFLYSMAFALGPKDAKNKIGFLWNAQQTESRNLFKTYILPLIKEVRPSTRVEVQQIVNFSDQDANGPGTILLCAPDHRTYIKLVLAYLSLDAPLSDYKLISTNSRGSYYTNSAINFMQAGKLLDFDKCINNLNFMYRKYYAVKFGESLFKNLKSKKQTIIHFNGEDISENADAMRKIKSLVRWQ